MSKNLAEKDFWEHLNKDIRFDKVNQDNLIRQWLNRYFHYTKEQKKCIEIGCFPGRYLTIFGDLGYELNGIDILEKTSTELPDWLNKSGYKVGKFIVGDFLDYQFSEKYDLVYSLGFIEHFTNWEDVLIKHAELVKKGGYLVIETPNFRGWIQRFLHLTTDNKNFKRHNIESMNPDKWEKVLGKEFKVIYKGYFYGFDFWVEEQKRYFFQKIILKIIFKTLPFIRKTVKINSKHFSPFCGLIVKKIYENSNINY
jgi:2-polyprenyl-3-methyl-5-hydroxy-6-metoxy-1,4-benzoquinol methylase